MRALLFGAAPATEDAFYRDLLAEDFDLVIGIDAGAEKMAALGRVPDVVVGDFDSASPGAEERLRAAGVQVVRFPARKDLSDLDLALLHARSAGATRLVMTGVLGGRLDHTLATLGALVSAADLMAEAREPDVCAWALDASTNPAMRLSGEAGQTFSVIAVGGPAVATIDDSEYHLSVGLLPPMSSLGLSNRLIDATASIEVAEGSAVVLAPAEEGRPRPTRSVRPWGQEAT